MLNFVQNESEFHWNLKEEFKLLLKLLGIKKYDILKQEKKFRDEIFWQIDIQIDGDLLVRKTGKSHALA